MSNEDYAHEYLNSLYEYGYTSCINTFTRVEKNSASCIDHIFLKSKYVYALEMCLPITIMSKITNHYVICLQQILSDTRISSHKNALKTIPFIDYKKRLNEVDSFSWDFIEHRSIESAKNIFVKMIKNAVIKNTNYKKIKHWEHKRKEWISKGLITSINRRDQLFKKTQNEPNNIVILNEYLEYRKYLKILIEKTKYEFYKNEIKNRQNNSSDLWNTVNKLTCTEKNNKKNKRIDCIIDEQNRLIRDKKELATLFNNYFTNVGKLLADKIEDPKNNNIQETYLPNSIFISPTDKFEVLNILLSLDEKKAGSGLPCGTLKKIATVIADPLSKLFNRIIESGEYPSEFKKSVIIPLHKGGSKMNLTNYRPISLIDNYGKIFEKILKKRITNFLEKYKVLSSQQYGFREGKSTEGALEELTETVYSALDRGEKCLSVFIDLSKAFDTVSHSKLLNTLESCGFRNKTLTLFKNYLKNREQCTKIENEQSEYLEVSYGVPQGSVLGPILFIIYTNSIFKLKTSGKVIAYADDTAILYNEKSWELLKPKIVKDLEQIKVWFDNKKLSMNFSKTNFLPFSHYLNGLPHFSKIKVEEK